MVLKSSVCLWIKHPIGVSILYNVCKNTILIVHPIIGTIIDKKKLIKLLIQ